LLIAKQVITKAGILLKRLPDSRNVAVPEYSQASFKEAILLPVAFDVLVLQKRDNGLCAGQTFCHGRLIRMLPG